MWGVATIVVVPEAAATLAIAKASGMLVGPSSRPGSRWQCRSITLTQRYPGALDGPGFRRVGGSPVKAERTLGLLAHVTCNRKRGARRRRRRIADV